MAFFKSLPDDAGARHLFMLNRGASRHLVEFHEKLLRGDSPLAPVEPPMKPILAYAKKLTLAPARMTQADAGAVFAAGWSERALHDAVLTVCLFNFMNRLLDGHGVTGDAAIYAAGLAYKYLEYGSYLSGWQRRLALKMWTGWPSFPMVFVKGVLVGGARDTPAACSGAYRPPRRSGSTSSSAPSPASSGQL